MFDKNKLSAGSGSMSAVFAVLILVVVIGFGIYYFQNKNESIKGSEVVNEVVNKENINSDTFTVKESGEVAYYNDKYDFSLTFPVAWQGLTATYREIKWAENLSNDSIDFALSDQPDGLFNIGVFTLEKWAELEKSEGPNKPVYINKNEINVFAWSMSQYAANEEMQKRRTEVEDIIKSFSLGAK